MTTREKLDFCLKKATEYCIDSQAPTGAWEITPDPRIFETALVGYALSKTPGIDANLVERAKQWITDAVPQTHSPVAYLVENAMKSILLGEEGVIDLTDPVLLTAELKSRLLLLYALSLYAGLPVKATIDEQTLRRLVSSRFAEAEKTNIKQWTKIEIAAVHILLQSRVLVQEDIRPALQVLTTSQDEDGGYFHNPVSTALAYLALCEVAPGSYAWSKCLQYLLRQQQMDGTWRFCSSDVWDTVLTLRSFRGYPMFDTVALPSGARFLKMSQNADGGWSFRSLVESDNDTTSAAILALIDTPNSAESCLKGLSFLARFQQSDGLWRTWKFTEDPPVEDVNAHIVAAVNATKSNHLIRNDAARRWLVDRFNANGRWSASWYRGKPYAVAEVTEALGPKAPSVQRALYDLEQSQNVDGGWGSEEGQPSTPSATGLALTALLDYRHINDFPRLKQGLNFLLDTQLEGGVWEGIPEMYGPRPLLSHYQTHTQAFTSRGLVKVWRQINNLDKPVKLSR